MRAVGDRDKRGQDGNDCLAYYGTRTPKGKDGETIFVPRSAHGHGRAWPLSQPRSLDRVAACAPLILTGSGEDAAAVRAVSERTSEEAALQGVGGGVVVAGGQVGAEGGEQGLSQDAQGDVEVEVAVEVER